MDAFDIVWNLFRKVLSNSLYRKLKSGPLGRPGIYFSLPTFKAVFERYRSSGYDFTGKNVLEVGSGNQFYTACFFLAAGARSVTLADPVFSIEEDDATRQAHIRSFTDTVGSHHPPDTAAINCSSSLEALRFRDTGCFDFIGSHFVLEHFARLETYFEHIGALLAPDGISLNYVDLSDHAYHVFDSRPLTRQLYRKRPLFHLRYSDIWYNTITDPRIWVNRALLPTYRELAHRYRFHIRKLNRTFCSPAEIHPDVIAKSRVIRVTDLYITHFSILLARSNGDPSPGKQG